jgi:hypothetical protein
VDGVAGSRTIDQKIAVFVTEDWLGRKEEDFGRVERVHGTASRCLGKTRGSTGGLEEQRRRYEGFGSFEHPDIIHQRCSNDYEEYLLQSEDICPTPEPV